MEFENKSVDRLDKLVSVVKKTDNLPTLPKIIEKITDLTNDDSVSVKYLGDLMSKDVSLSARILKIVNSPMYGFSQRIYSINHAIVLLGANVLKSIIVSTSVFTIMKEAMEGLWEHSIYVGFISKHIANALNNDKNKLIQESTKKKYTVDGDMVFSAGLLHDIGMLIIATTFKDDFKKIIESVEHGDRPLVDIEYEYLNTSHDYLGYLLTKEWNLPAGIYIPIKYHHNPSLTDDYKIEAAVVNLSNFIAKALGIGFMKNSYIEKLDPKILEILECDVNFVNGIIREVYSFKDELYIFN